MEDPARIERYRKVLNRPREEVIRGGVRRAIVALILVLIEIPLAVQFWSNPNLGPLISASISVTLMFLVVQVLAISRGP